MKQNAFTALFSGIKKKNGQASANAQNAFFEYTPLISVLVQGSTKKVSASLANQKYKNYELVSDAGSVTGDFVLFLTEDCILDENALSVFTAQINKNRNADMLYSDEENAGMAGGIYKPDYSEVTSLSYNSIGLPIMVSRRVFSRLGKIETDSGDALFSLALKCAAVSENIVHIRRILLSRTDKYIRVSNEGGFEAIRAYLQTKRRVMVMEAGLVRSTFNTGAISKKGEVLSVAVIASEARLLARLLESIEECACGIRMEILVVKNTDCDSELENYCRLLENSGAVTVITAEERNYSAMCNEAARRSEGEILIFADESMEMISPLHIKALADCANETDAGAVCPKVLSADGRIFECGLTVGLFGRYASLYKGEEDELCDAVKNSFVNVKREVSAVSSLCFAVRRDVLFASGGFDETIKSNEAAVELSLRMKRRGFKNIYTPFSVMIKHDGAAKWQKSADEEQRMYGVLRPLLLEGDPFYNINYDPISAVPRVCREPYPPIELNPNYSK